MENMCPHCQLEVPKGQFICPICGIDLRDWNPDKLRCPICRSLYPQGTKFCFKDGSPLEKAIVDFDTEATIFLSGTMKTQKPKPDDIIPTLKFSEDRNRAFPKLERDQKGHLAPPPPPPPPLKPRKSPQVASPPPPPFSKNPPIKPELEKPEITIDPSPQLQPPKEPEQQHVQEPSKPVSPDPFIDSRIDYEVAATGHHLKVKPLEEYERLLKEEAQTMAEKSPAHSASRGIRFNTIQQKRPGFIKRFIIALRVLIGK